MPESGTILIFVDTFNIKDISLRGFNLFGSQIDENGYYQEKENFSIIRYLIEKIN